MTARDLLKILKDMPSEALDQDMYVQTNEGNFDIEALNYTSVDFGNGDVDTLVYFIVKE